MEGIIVLGLLAVLAAVGVSWIRRKMGLPTGRTWSVTMTVFVLVALALYGLTL